MALFRRKKYAEADYDPLNAPSSRGKQFWMALRRDKWLLFRIGLCLLLFLLPHLLLLFGEADYRSYVDALYLEESITLEERSYSLLYANLAFHGAGAVTILIFFLGLGGPFEILSNLAYGEGALFQQDYFAGFASRWKKLLVLSFLPSVYRFLSATLYDLMIARQQWAYTLGYGLSLGFSLFFLAPLILILLVQVALFPDNTLRTDFQNALPLLGVSYGNSLLLALPLTVFPFLHDLLGDNPYYVLAFGLTVLLFFPYWVLGTILYGISLAEKHLDLPKEEVGRGLYSPDGAEKKR